MANDYRCDTCGTRFDNEVALEDHLAYVLAHPNEDGSPLCRLDEEPYTVSCPPNRKHHGTIEFAPTDARHPVCPVCSMEVAR